jgi:hypothetical protein
LTELEERRRLAEDVAEQDHAGWNTLEQSELVHAGSRAPGAVIAVEDTGTTVPGGSDPLVTAGNLSRV